MERLSAHDITVLLLGLGTLLAVARILGEVARGLNQPAVVGELLAGVLLGPTVLGALAPAASEFLFPRTGPVAVALQGMVALGITLFLLVAGMEVDLSTMWRQGRPAAIIGVAGILFPFALGFTAAWLAPNLLGVHPGADPTIFALFFATACSISALPVIARTLMDLALYRSDLGMMIIAAAVFNDLVGWIIFAVILSLMGRATGLGLPLTIGLTLGYAVVMLTFGRWLINRTLPWLQAHTSWPGGVLGFSLAAALFGAAFTEWIGVHAIFGAFLMGVAIGDSPHLREHTRAIINDFISFIFAPLFFASIGLAVNFATSFQPLLVVLVLVIACVGKLVGCGIGARLSGMPARESWAVGFGMNARGAMEIILGLLALENGLISEPMFVALVVMALATSVISGPAIHRLLGLRRRRRLGDYLSGRNFVSPLLAATSGEAIAHLSQTACATAGLEPMPIVEAVRARERLMPTGIGNGVAVPHARIAGLTAPLVALGLSNPGIDFDSPDGEPAHFVFLILTPQEDNGAQIEILADIARTFSKAEARGKLLEVGSFTEFLALLRTA